MRILFASVDDASNVGAWSGTPYYMYRALAASGAEMVLASPLRERFGLPFKVMQTARNLAGRGGYSRQREPLILAGYARQIREAAELARPDVILAPSSLPVARLDSDSKLVFWTDATFAGMTGYYPSFTGLSSRHRRIGNQMEDAALGQASLAVYSSQWAADTAARSYDVPTEKLAVIPFGANIDDPGRLPYATDPEGPCRLLLVGNDWHRKGADLAVATLIELRRRGIDATLDIVGSQPPREERLPHEVTIHPSVDKRDTASADRLRSLYRRASFFVLPSRADCTPIVLAEAAAYGLPVLACATGGMAAMLRDGQSGYLVGTDGFPARAAVLIEQAWREGKHRSMATQARLFYEEKVNWETAARALLDVMDSRLVTT